MKQTFDPDGYIIMFVYHSSGLHSMYLGKISTSSSTFLILEQVTFDPDVTPVPKNTELYPIIKLHPDIYCFQLSDIEFGTYVMTAYI